MYTTCIVNLRTACCTVKVLYLVTDPPLDLNNVRLMDDPAIQDTAAEQSPQSSFLGAALPPIPQKLVKKIESGKFIELGDLLAGNLSHSQEDPKQKSRHHRVSNVTEWLQGFAAYVAVLSKKQPHRIPDLMGYQLIILEAYAEFRNDGWLAYDRRFRQWAASHHKTRWAAIEPTLWSFAFQGQARSNRCKHCFSLSHNSVECEFSPDFSARQQQNQLSRSTQRPICYQWNDTPSPTCTYRNCRYDHVCYICANSPTARNLDHKALFCPFKSTDRGAISGPPRKWRFN